jgi:hypothetical protein
MVEVEMKGLRIADWGFWIADCGLRILDLRNSDCLIIRTERACFAKLATQTKSDTTDPKSLRGIGPYDPSGFRLVERAYSSERPEAEI